MRVYFSTKNGRKLHVDVDRSSTVETLQCKIVQTLRLNDLQPEDCTQLGRSDLQLSLGGELLEPNRLLSTYALEEGSVVHPRWGSVRAALEVNDAFTWLDPDWHEEIRRRGSRAAGSFLERVCTSPGPTITGLIWPGPLVPQTRAPARRPQAAPTTAHTAALPTVGAAAATGNAPAQRHAGAAAAAQHSLSSQAVVASGRERDGGLLML